MLIDCPTIVSVRVILWFVLDITIDYDVADTVKVMQHYWITLDLNPLT